VNYKVSVGEIEKQTSANKTQNKATSIIYNGGTPRILATEISENCSARVDNMLLNGTAQIEETAAQLAETQLPGNGVCQSSHNCVAAWFPSVGCSVTRLNNSFVS
jgi:hypothetical protein